MNNPETTNFIILLLSVIAVLIGIYFLLKKIRATKNSKEWIESHKTMPTTMKNVKALAKKANLTSDEKDLLASICREFKPRNIEFLVKEEDEMEGLLKSAYDSLVSKNSSDETIANFFNLKFKLESIRAFSMFLTTTTSLTEGQEFVYRDADGTKWTLVLSKNSPQGMTLDIPKSLAKSDKRPEPLTKIMLTFSTKGDISYTLLTRIIRYDEYKEGNFRVTVSSSNSLKPIQRRLTKRLSTNISCQFSAARKSNKKKHSKTAGFEILPNKYDGMLQDISASGCRISCKMPIMQGQYLELAFTLGTSQPRSCIGLIVMTKKAQNGKEFVLHVKFINLALSAKNDIYAYIYGYREL